jgi:hypothetical protein
MKDMDIGPFDKEFTEAKQVIDHFISNDVFQTGDKFTANIHGKAGYIFRGESNSRWPLLPRAFRPETDWPKFTPQPPQNGIVDTKRWLLNTLHAEATAINLFLEAADTLGITTPIDYSIKQHDIDSIFNARDKVLNENQEYDFDDVFPSNDYVRSIALAQHYGVPTRFLDWSESPLVACYFAAEQASCISNSSCSSLKSSTNQIVIYYFNVWPIRDDWPIEVLKTPRHENTNLLSQKGIFVNFKNANSYFLEHRKWPDLYEYYPKLQINKVLLPGNKSDDLLRLLFDLGITRYSLFPSLANAARAYEYKYKLFPK